MKRREHRELLMSGDLRRGKLEVSPLVAPLVLSLFPFCLCLYLWPFRDLDFIPMHTGFSWCLVLLLFLSLFIPRSHSFLILSIPVPVKVCFACPRNCWCWCFLLVLFLFLRLLLLLAIFLDSCLFLCQPCSYDLICIFPLLE